MITNFFKIAWRSLWNKKAFSAINIIGLAIGLATCILILLFVQSELNYDRFNLNADRIYRATLNGKIGGREINIAAAPAPIGPALSSDYPGIELYTRLSREGSFLVNYENEKFKEERVVFADSNFFSIFSIPMLKGNSRSALKEPNTIVITEATAEKYFGEKDPMGKSISLGTRGLFRITGVCKNIPADSHFHFDFFGSLASVHLGEKWLSSGAHTYLLLKKNYPAEKLAALGPQLVKKYIAPEIQEFLGMSYEEYIRKGDRFGFSFQPLTDIHLNSDLEAELEPNGDIKYVYIFSAIAVFILLIACINFMNLSTAGSANRAKEVGIRKVLGSIQQQLIFQFLTESVLITFLALLVAFVFVIAVLPSFNQLANKQFYLTTILNFRMILYAFAGCLVVGLLAGSYPAFFLSAFRPISVLKGKLQMGVKSGWLRNTLVTVQFVVSIGMIIGTIVVYQQLRFIQDKKVGFDKDQVLVLEDTYVLGDKIKPFKEELKRLSQVQNVTLAGYIPAGNSNNGTDGFLPESAAGVGSPYRLRTYQIDEDYLTTLGIGLLTGRNFSKSFSSDSAAILVNEAAVKQFGWKNPIGQRVATVGNGTPQSKHVYTVVGVTKNFHFESMHENIAPLIMMYGGDWYQMALRVRTDDMAALLKTLEKDWKAQTDSPFSYTFLNERFNKMYQSEQRIGALFGIFAGLAVVIACLGLFGLAAFTTLQRYGMSQWLKDFAYKIEIEWWVFALAGLLTVCTALLTISFQSIKAALMNPVKSLKSE